MGANYPWSLTASFPLKAMVLGGLRSSSYWVSVTFSMGYVFRFQGVANSLGGQIFIHSSTAWWNNFWIKPAVDLEKKTSVHSFIEGLSHIHLWEFHHRQIYNFNNFQYSKGGFIERTPVALPASWYHKKETMCIYYIHTLPETNVAPTTRPSQKESSLSTFSNQFSGVMLVSGRV